jgi:hypothetical protein
MTDLAFFRDAIIREVKHLNGVYIEKGGIPFLYVDCMDIPSDSVLSYSDSVELELYIHTVTKELAIPIISGIIERESRGYQHYSIIIIIAASVSDPNFDVRKYAINKLSDETTITLKRDTLRDSKYYQTVVNCVDSYYPEYTVGEKSYIVNKIMNYVRREKLIVRDIVLSNNAISSCTGTNYVVHLRNRPPVYVTYFTN